jgi:hypothetical protein
MKFFLILILITSFISCFNEPRKNNELSIDNKENLDFLKTLDGQFPYKSKIFENEKFTKRIRKLLGSKYNFLIETWAVETPIKIYNSTFIARACEAHNCGSTNFIIVYNFSNKTMSIGVREEKKISIYSESEKNSPIIADWEKEM